MSSMYLGKLPRPAYGIRLPDIVAPALLKSFKNLGVLGTLMLSYHRETAPRRVIESTDPKYFYFGHTGTSIDEYITKARSYAEELSIPVEIEADHVSIMGSVERAIKRIAGAGFEAGLSEAEIQASLSYIEEEFREVSKVGGVDFVTIDTCELVDLRVDEMSDSEAVAEYENRIEPEARRELEARYLDKVFTFLGSDRVIRFRISRAELARLSLKYLKSIEYVARIVEIVEKYNGREFGIEVALDELPQVTRAKEAFFYINELLARGIHVDFVAPNIGFAKREDYRGDLYQLFERVRNLHTVLSSLGAYISIHSGSGAHPYSDKGFGVWQVLRKATSGALKYKMSGVLIQLLLEVMARFPPGSRPRRLYEEIFDAVVQHLKKELDSGRGLASPALEKMLGEYEEEASRGRARDPRSEVFRHYFFVFQTLRDEKGRRWLRDAVLELYREDEEFRKAYEREVLDLVERQCRALGYIGNALRYKAITL